MVVSCPGWIQACLLFPHWFPSTVAHYVPLLSCIAYAFGWFLQPLPGDHILYHQLTPKCFCGEDRERSGVTLKFVLSGKTCLCPWRPERVKCGGLLLTSHLVQCVMWTFTVRSCCRHIPIVPSFLVLTGETMSPEYICMLITLSLCIWEFLSWEEWDNHVGVYWIDFKRLQGGTFIGRGGSV